MAYSPAGQQQTGLVTDTAAAWKFELILALVLLAIGGLVVPVAVYWVGGLLAGEYAGEGGIRQLFLSIWSDAGRGRLSAWVLFLAPYLAVQLIRLAWVLLRPPQAVTDVTNIENNQ